MKNTELQMNELLQNMYNELSQLQQDTDYLLVTFNAEADMIVGDVSRDPRVLRLTRKLEKAVEAIREVKQYAKIHLSLTK